MNKTKTIQLFGMLASKHGLVGWTFEFSRARTILGQCSHARKKIVLSEAFMNKGTEAEITNTLLHEIAHALVGPGHGHDNVWRRKHISMGGSGERCSGADVDLRTEARWIGTCPNCGHKSRFLRAPLRVQACPQHGRVFKKENVYSWTKDGRTAYLSDMPARYIKEHTKMFS